MIIVDVAIGLALVYLMLAILVSSVHEMLAMYLQQRGKLLKKGIESLLCGATVAKDFDGSLLKKIYDHPSINILRDGTRLPAYIPSASYAVALADVLVQTGQAAKPLFAGLPEAVKSLPEGDLKRSLTVLVDRAGGSPERLKALMEEQFNDVMDRVSGWYKRSSQSVMFVIALVFAVGLNIDTLHLGHEIIQDQNLRNRLIREAEVRVAAQSNPPAKLDPASSAVAQPAPEKGKAPGLKQDAVLAEREASLKKAHEDLEAKKKELNKNLDDLRALDLPIGWKPNCPDGKQDCCEILRPHGVNLTWSSFLMVAVGWLLTALAGSLGAPFWFDLLSKLIKVRGSGPNPNEAAKTAPGSSGTTPQEAAEPAPLAAVSPPPEPAPEASGPRNDFEHGHLTELDITGIQEALGLPAAAVTGELDATTRSAIRRWQTARQMTATGELNDTTVRAILYREGV